MLQQTARKRSVGAAQAQPQAAPGKPAAVLLSRDDDELTPSYLRNLYTTFAYDPVATDHTILGAVGFGN